MKPTIFNPEFISFIKNTIHSIDKSEIFKGIFKVEQLNDYNINGELEKGSIIYIIDVFTLMSNNQQHRWTFAYNGTDLCLWAN